MKKRSRLICFIVCILCLQSLCCVSFAESNSVWEMFYPYCESELGYTRDDLTPNQYQQYDDGGWAFSFYVKDAEPMTNGLVIGELDADGKLVEIRGPVPESIPMWLNMQIRKCMLDYRELYLLKQEWEPKLDGLLSEEDMQLLNSAKSFNPILDFLRLDIVLPDEKCIPYEEAKQKSVEIIEAIDGWTDEKTEYVDIMVEMIYIPSGMDHPVWQFIYTTASSVYHQRIVSSNIEYTDAMAKEFDRLFDKEDVIFGKDIPRAISVRIDAYTGEQVGETYYETPSSGSSLGYTGIVVYK